MGPPFFVRQDLTVPSRALGYAATTYRWLFFRITVTDALLTRYCAAAGLHPVNREPLLVYRAVHTNFPRIRESVFVLEYIQRTDSLREFDMFSDPRRPIDREQQCRINTMWYNNKNVFSLATLIFMTLIFNTKRACLIFIFTMTFVILWRICKNSYICIFKSSVIFTSFQRLQIHFAVTRRNDANKFDEFFSLSFFSFFTYTKCYLTNIYLVKIENVGILVNNFTLTLSSFAKYNLSVQYFLHLTFNILDQNYLELLFLSSTFLFSFPALIESTSKLWFFFYESVIKT